MFSYYLEENLRKLQTDLENGHYTHGGYKTFIVTDNKRREISVASVRDRVVHRILYEYLVPIYDKTFIYDAWSCRKDKGLLGAIERYVDRQELDPAFLSRLHKIEYDYLPQKNEGSLEEEAGPENELFHLLLAKTMDKNGNLEAPKDTLAKLWTLAKAARVTQDVFAGKEIQSAFYFQEGGSRATPYMLKESVMSIRAIEDIISQWQKEGYKRELDYYIWEEFISQSTEASDRAYLYQLLKDRFGFFRGEGWEQNPSYDSNRIAQSFDIKTPSNPAEEAEFFGPRDIVRAAFGAPPERAKWPEAEVSEKKEKEASLEALASLEEFKNALGEELANVEKEVAEVCEVGSGDSSPSPTTLSPKGKRGGFAGQVNKNEKKKEKNK